MRKIGDPVNVRFRTYGRGAETGIRYRPVLLEFEPAHVYGINTDGTIRVRVVREDLLLDVDPEDLT